MTRINLIFTKKERVLLLHSSITSQYPWLITMLHEQPLLAWDELPLYSDLLDTRNEMTRLHIEQIKEVAVREWQCNKDDALLPDSGQLLTCEICGYSRCTILFGIRNSINGKKLYIGTECAKVFGITGADQLKIRENAIRQLQTYGNLIRLVPEIEGFIVSKSRTASAKYKLPSELQQQTLSTFNKVKDLANNYRSCENDEIRESLVRQIKEQIAAYLSLCQKVDQYENEQMNDPTAILVRDMEEIKNLHGKWAKVRAALEDKTHVDKSCMQYFVNNAFLQRYVIERMNAPLQQMDIAITQSKDRWLSGTLRSSGLHIELDVQAFMSDYAAYVINNITIPDTHEEKVRKMLRATDPLRYLLHRAKRQKARWLDFCAICTVSGEIIISSRSKWALIDGQQLVRRCSPLLLYPTSEMTTDFFELMDQPVQSFSSETEARQLIKERTSDRSNDLTFEIL